MEVTTNGVGPIIKLTNTVTCTSLAESGPQGSVCASENHSLTNVSYALNGGVPVRLCSGLACGSVFDLSSASIPLAPCDNTITISATDDQGLNGSTTYTITHDSTPPTLVGCTNIVITTDSTNGAVVNYNVTALDGCDANPQVTCVSPPGLFPVGQSVVTCTAVDHCGNTAICEFTVKVRLECTAILDEQFTATGTNGAVSYRFCVRNQSDHDLGYVTLVDLSAGVSATPYFIPLTPPVPPGQTACVTVTLSGASGRTNLCYRLMAHSPDFMQCCIIEHCAPMAVSDLYVEDTPVGYVGAPDLGGEPDANMVGQPMWVSRGIWVHEDCVQLPGTYLTHQNPRYGQQNCVFAEIKNRGTVPVAGAKVELWYANASLGLVWPAGWSLIGTVTLPTIIAGGSTIAQAPWYPPGTGHYCLIARIVSAADPMTTPEGPNIYANVQANNNLAWRNVNVADCLNTPGNKVEVTVNNFTPAPKKLTLIFTVDQDFLTDGGEAILSPGTPLFDRWIAAGAHGVNVVVINGNEIRFTGSPARFEDIPFAANEARVFNLTLRAGEPMPVPGTSHTYHASLMQEIDHQVVGGVNYVIVTRALDTDTDGDGIPDVNDPDDDNDGIPDAIDPNPIGEPDCPPAALSISRIGDEVSLTWSGLGYRLEATTDFNRWDELPGVRSPATLRANTPYRFFRLICR